MSWQQQQQPYEQPWHLQHYPQSQHQSDPQQQQPLPSWYQQPVSSTANYQQYQQQQQQLWHQHYNQQQAVPGYYQQQQLPPSQSYQQQPQRQYAPPRIEQPPLPQPQIEPTPPPQIEQPPPPKLKEPYRPFPPPPFYEVTPEYETEFCALNIDKEKDPTKARVNGYIVRWINDNKKRWKEPPPPDWMLDDFWDGFGDPGWTENIFNVADKQALRDLRTCLREHGVFVRTTRGVSIAATLVEILEACKKLGAKEEELHVWTPEEIEEQMKYRAKKERAHQRREAYIKSQANPQS